MENCFWNAFLRSARFQKYLPQLSSVPAFILSSLFLSSLQDSYYGPLFQSLTLLFQRQCAFTVRLEVLEAKPNRIKIWVFRVFLRLFTKWIIDIFILCSSRKLPLSSLASIIVYNQNLFYEFYALTIIWFLLLNVKTYCLRAKHWPFILNNVTFNTLSINCPYYGEFHSFWIGCLTNIHLNTRAC